jgi:hypothetical protein
MATLSYTERPFTRLDATYQTPYLWFEATDLNGDGNVDLLVLGADYPIGKTTYAPQPGRLFLGDGKGGFALAPANLFPVNELFTVHVRKVLFEDFNGDGRKDVFVADHGWDTAPFPGQQNLLYLSTPQGGWRSATATLPQVADFTHSAAAADIDGDGDIDIMVGNGYNNERLALEAPYMLMNNGQGVFTRDDGRLPIKAGEALDQSAITHFPGTAFADVDRDGRPDLIVTADASASFDQYRQTTVFWNVDGRFESATRTQLTQPVGLAAHIDLDAATADFDGDGLLDMVLIGTNGQPFYDGGFVQMFRGLGGRRFEDISSQVLPVDGRLWAANGISTGTPWPMWVKVQDFNGDLAPDFLVQYGGPGPRQDSPMVWLNDGTGKFSVIKASAFAGPGQEWQFGGGLLVPSATGLQNYTLQMYPGSNGLLLTGRVSAGPYFGRPNDTGPEVLTGTQYTNWFVGGLGNDTIDGAAGEDYVVYGNPISNYSITIDTVGLTATISSKEDGVDTVKNVERFLFSGMSTPVTFAQLGDMKPPMLTSAKPASGSRQVAVDAALTFTFDESIRLGSGSIQLKRADGTVWETFDPLSAKVSGKELTLTPTKPLQVFTDYTVTFGPRALEDVAGNAFVLTQSFPIKTATQDSLYHFFVVAFAAAPGATYMGQLAEAVNYGLPLQQIVEIFTSKTQFTSVYPTSMSNRELATQLVNNIVKTSASAATRQSAIDDIDAALSIGWSRGKMLYTVFGNLASKPLTDPTWGATAKQFQNQLAVARYFTEEMSVATENLATLRGVIGNVTPDTDVSTVDKIVQIIGTVPPGG